MSWNTYVTSGGIRSTNFESHAKALKHYNEVKPIRGRTPDCRPLGSNRTYTQCTITHDPLTENVSANLYGTPCVTISDNNTIKLNHGGWASPSTCNFMDAVLPRQFGRVYLARKRIVLKTFDGREFVIPEQGLTLKASADWSTAEPILDNAPTLYEYKADRKVMNAIRKKVKPFLDAAHVMTSMSSTYNVAEVTYFFPEAVDKYVEAYNTHNANVRASEDAKARGDTPNNVYVGHFYGEYTFRSMLLNYAGAPRLYVLSYLGENVKNLNGGTTRKLTTAPYGDTAYTDEYQTEQFLSIVKWLFDNDAETIRKVVVSIVTNGVHYARQVHDQPTTQVDTLFGKIGIPNMEWFVSGSYIESYVIDVLKYVYADLIFKKVEVPQGVLPSTLNEKYVLCNKYLVEQEDIMTRRYVVL